MSTDSDKIPLNEHLDALNGHLDTTALLQDLWMDDELRIPWATYVMPADDQQMADKTVIDTYREYKDDMSDKKIEELLARLQDERNRRKSRARKAGEADD